ncbi:MAG: O-antigen polymerase [Thermoanaerobaculia bacterium]
MTVQPESCLREPRRGTSVTLLALGLLTAASAAVEPLGELVALPGLWFWIAVMAAALATPFLVQRRFGAFEPFSPVTYPVWTYLAPVFVVGSALLASGIAKQAPDLIPVPVDLQYCLAMAYLVVGWTGLLIGYYCRWGDDLGARVRRRLPDTRWTTVELRVSAALLLAAGLGLYWLAFRLGVIGHQRLATVGPWDGLLIFLSFVSHVAAFLLWFSLFERPSWTGGERALAVGLYLLGPLSLTISASRAGLVTHLLLLALAFRLAGRRIRWRHVILFGVLGAASLAIGTIWSTTYRLSKGDEAPIYRTEEQSAEPRADSTRPTHRDSQPQEGGTQARPEGARASNLELVTETAEIVAERGLTDNVLFVLRNVAVRIEITSSVAMLVAKYRLLRPMEEQTGLAGNIWRDTWTAPIPRFLWPDKPKVSDARTYSLVYFDYGGTSFAMTPVGDLLRNFGPVGVPLGMALLGFALRLLYRTLVAGPVARPAPAAIYAIGLMNINYEGFYGSLLPTVMRLVAVTGGALVAVHLGVVVQRRIRRSHRS